MERLRKFYGVPAKRGMVVKFQGDPVTIIGTASGPMYLRVREEVEGSKPVTYLIHPTWSVEYPTP